MFNFKYFYHSLLSIISMNYTWSVSVAKVAKSVKSFIYWQLWNIQTNEKYLSSKNTLSRALLFWGPKYLIIPVKTFSLQDMPIESQLIVNDYFDKFDI